VTWRLYHPLRTFFGDRTNFFDDLHSMFEARTIRPRDPVGIRVIPCSPIEKEAVVDQGDSAGQVPLSSSLETLPIAAQGAGAQAIGALLQSFRPYLLSIATHELPGNLRGKCDPADLVQEMPLEAHRGLAGYNEADSNAFRVWLCGILRHNLMDLIRRHRDAAKRSVGRERSLADGPESDGPAVEQVDPHPTPCTRSIAREEVAALREALSHLPEHEQCVISLRDFDVLSFEEIGRRLGCSSEAARKLCFRAMTRLQRMLKTSRGPGA
jgi:RNA polymerase sigma-70 factor (subfamily 1)